jgi:hypothetical protein
LIIDSDTFAELAVLLKRASDSTLKAATSAKDLSPYSPQEADHLWQTLIGHLMDINARITDLHDHLKAVHDANTETPPKDDTKH